MTAHTTLRRAGRATRAAAAAAALAAAALGGCDDTLTTAAQPQGTLSEGTLATLAGTEGSLVAAYRALDYNTAVGGSWGNAASDWVWASVASDDAYKGSEANDQAPINDIEAYNWSTANTDGYLNDKWRGSYEGVVRANATLRVLKQVQDTRPNEITPANARGIAGEALFLRAHYHFSAWRVFGRIPYYREDDADFRKPNIESDAVVTEILKDLDSAIVLLPTSARNGGKGRATQWTAKAYKGRVQAYAGQWPAARATLTEVRAGGPYRLEQSYDRVWTGFTDYRNGPETILAFQASANDQDTDGNNANWGERLNFPHSGSPYGCCGFHQPSQNLVNFFAVDADGLPAALSNPSWNANNATFVAGAATPVDPRLDWTVGRDGVPYKDAGVHQPSWIRAPAYGGPYSPKKNAHEKASGAQSTVGWNPQHLNSVPIHIFRYADALLLLAEAEVEAGSPEVARTIVNEIRERAGRAAQGPGTDRGTIAVPLNDPRITWATYRVSPYPAAGWTQDYARQAVRAERRLELAMEGQRFFDLRRWGVMEQVLNDYLAVEKTRRPHLTAASAVTDRHRLFPIPEQQRQLSTVNGQERLTQNPGW